MKPIPVSGWLISLWKEFDPVVNKPLDGSYLQQELVDKVSEVVLHLLLEGELPPEVFKLVSMDVAVAVEAEVEVKELPTSDFGHVKGLW